MELKQFFSWKTFILTLLCGVFAGLNSATYADTLNDIISSLFNLVQNELIINSGNITSQTIISNGESVTVLTPDLIKDTTIYDSVSVTRLIVLFSFVPYFCYLFFLHIKYNSFLEHNKKYSRHKLRYVLLLSIFVGFIFGVGYFFTSSWWMMFPAITLGLPVYLGIFCLVILFLPAVTYIGFTFTFFITLERIFKFHTYYLTNFINLWQITLSILSVATMYTLFEYILENFILNGFPYNELSHSIVDYLPFIQIAEFFGTHFITFLIILINLLISFTIIFAIYRNIIGASIFAIVALFIVSINIFYGAKVIEHRAYQTELTINNVTDNDKDWFRFGLVEPNYNQTDKWSHTQIEPIATKLLELGTLAKNVSLSNGHYLDAILYSENAFTLDITHTGATDSKYMQSSDLVNRLHDNFTGMNVITGVTRIDFNVSFVGSIVSQSQKMNIYNSLVVLNFLNEDTLYHLFENKYISAVYDKQWLVPFGEYYPFESIFGWLYSIALGGDIGSYNVGNTVYNEFNMTLSGGRKIYFAPLICIEGSHTGMLSSPRGHKVDFILIISNNSWVRTVLAKRALFRSQVLRSVEFRKPIISVTQDGISGVVSSNGNALKLDDGTGIITSKMYVNFNNENDRTINTFYAERGLVWLYLISFIAFLYVLRRIQCLL